MNQPAPPKSSNPLLFIAGVAGVFLLIGLSYLVFPSAPPTAAANAGAGEEVVFVLDTAPAAPAAAATKP